MERYDRLAMLGRGSYATVSLVRLRDGEADGAPRRAVLSVAKEVDLLRADERGRKEALREAEVLKSLTHPNIIAYHDAFLAEARLYIVMEYADGGDLCAAIRRHREAGRRYHEREAMAIFGQLALALQYIHDRRVLHRDLKSQNVFLTRAGMAKLGDFGIAKVLKCDELAETQIGTPYYLPPEMCTSRPYDFRADVWCLGIVLYELLALEVPFSAPTMAELVMLICQTEPRPVPQVYSTEARILLSRMLAKSPEDRPSSTDIISLPHVRRSLAPGAQRHAAATPFPEGPAAGPEPQDSDAYGDVSGAPPPRGQDEDCLHSQVACTAASPVSDSELDALLATSPIPPAELAKPAANSPLPLSLAFNDEQLPLLQGSLTHALENTASCEKLLHELERELSMA